MDTIILWHFNQEKKKRGSIFATKDEYLLALKFEPREEVEQDLKRQIKAFIKSRYKVSVHQLTYRDKPLYAVCKKFGGVEALCEQLNISQDILCDLSFNFTNPHLKSQLLIDYLLPVLTDQEFANWFYSTVYNLYNDTREPLIFHPDTLPQSFYEWLAKDSRYTKLNSFITGKSIPSGMMVGDYIYEHRDEYKQVYNTYSSMLLDYIQSLSGKEPMYITNLKQRTTVRLKRYGVLISHKLESMGLCYKSYIGMYNTTSPKMTKYIKTIAQEVGYDPYDMLYTIVLNSVDYYVKKPSHKRNVTTEYLREQKIHLKRL